MKANLFAVVLLFFIVCLPTHSASNQLSEPPVKLAQKSSAKINLNKADANTLYRSIKGIGKKRAQAIVKYRVLHGNFNSLDELAKVPGFGHRFVKNHLKQLQEVFTVN